MSARRFPRKSAVFALLLAAAAGGVIVLRREEDRFPERLPVDLTEAIQEAATSSGDPELRRFYELAGWQPVWRGREAEALSAFRNAASRGLPPGSYEPALETSAAARDLALTRSLMRYASDLRHGRFNPGLYEKERLRPSDLAWAVARDPGGVAAGLRKLDPPFEAYWRLAQALPTATAEQRAAMERTMERWRWLPRSFPRGAILVNIPEFQVRAFDANLQAALEMRAVVGLRTNQTPVFTADLKYLVFGPYWNVPRSILIKELLPDIVKNPSYLANNAYEVVDSSGRVVATGDATGEVLAGLESGRYWVRQVPGPKNALGRVKFMFPNTNDVYLHDTNARNLFSREVRAFSHGCVRVEKPQELAEWVLRNETEWPKERIVEALKRTSPLHANLKEPIPVFMVYHTAMIAADGSVRILKDLYGHDATLQRQMAATTAGPAPRPRE